MQVIGFKGVAGLENALVLWHVLALRLRVAEIVGRAYADRLRNSGRIFSA